MPTLPPETTAQQTLGQWKERAEKSLKGIDFQKKCVSRLDEGVEVFPLYSPENAPQNPQRPEPPAPSVSIRQEVKHPTPEGANRLWHKQLAGGASSAAAVLHPQWGLGVRADYRRSGLQLESPSCLEAFFQGVFLDMLPVHFTPGARPALLMGLLLAWGQQNPERALRSLGGLGAFPWHGCVLAEDETVGCNPSEIAKEILAASKGFENIFPHFRWFSLSSESESLAGGTAAHEVASLILQWIELSIIAKEFNCSEETLLSRTEFRVSVGTDQFLEMAKIRSLKILLRSVLALSGVPNGAAISVHATTAPAVQTQRDPWVNLLRNTTAAFAAVTGGAESVTVLPFDSRLGEATPLSDRMARNTMHILLEESHLADIGDPGAGSWYIEHLTQELAKKAWDLVQKVGNIGGYSASLKGEKSFWVESLNEAQLKKKKDIATRKAPLTGVSRFPNLSENSPSTVQLSASSIESSLIERTQDLLKRRSDAPDFEKLLGATHLTRVFEIAQLFSKGALAQELGAVLTSNAKGSEGGQWGIHRCQSLVRAQMFEHLRLRSETLKALTGRWPEVLLVTLGSRLEHFVRVDFVRTALDTAGLLVQVSPLEQVVSPTHAIAVVCGSDALYGAQGVDAIVQLKKIGFSFVALAGQPPECTEALKQAGVDFFLTATTPLPDILSGWVDVFERLARPQGAQ